MWAAKREATGRAEADVVAWQARAETAAGEVNTSRRCAARLRGDLSHYI